MEGSGPGKYIPKVCATRNTLADLGDTRGFRDPGEGRVYGLALTREGYYARSPITVGSEEPDWDLQLELRPLNIDLEGPEGEAQKIKRLVNQGKMFAFYVKAGLESLMLSGQVNDYYLGPMGNQLAKLKAHTTILADAEIIKKPPRGSTIYLQLELGAAPTSWVEVISGLSLKWRQAGVVGLVLTNSDGKWSVSATDQDVQTQPKQVDLTFIYSGINFRFKRLLFSTTPIPSSYIERLTVSPERPVNDASLSVNPFP